MFFGNFLDGSDFFLAEFVEFKTLVILEQYGMTLYLNPAHETRLKNEWGMSMALRNRTFKAFLSFENQAAFK